MRFLSLLLRIAPLLAFVAVLPDLDGQTAEAAFPGTNGRIAFYNFTNNDAEIWTANADGSDRMKITASA